MSVNPLSSVNKSYTSDNEGVATLRQYVNSVFSIFQKFMDEWFLEKFSIIVEKVNTFDQKLDAVVWHCRFAIFYNTKQIGIVYRAMK